jgi:cytochrome P450
VSDPADATPEHEHTAAGATLQQEVAALMARWQQAGVAAFDVAVLVATAACRALGHAVGDLPPPEGPELLQQLSRHLQREAESCYFAHWENSSL